MSQIMKVSLGHVICDGWKTIAEFGRPYNFKGSQEILRWQAQKQGASEDYQNEADARRQGLHQHVEVKVRRGWMLNI